MSDATTYTVKPVRLTRKLRASRRLLLCCAGLLAASLTCVHAQTVYEGNASANAIEGTALIESCSGCLNGTRIGNIGDGSSNYLRIKDISVPTSGTYTVTLYYTEGSDGGARSFTTQINDVAGPTLSNLTGTSWTAPAAPVSFQANFTAGSGNSVGFFNATTSAPDVDHITVSGNGAAVTKIVAPYVDMGMGSPYNNVPSMTASAGLKYATLAFIIANGSSCSAAWDDYTPISSEDTYAGYIQTLRNNGGDGIISFGGEGGDELADVCTSTSTLQAQYQAVITKYNVTRLDFDIEYDSGDAIDNTTAIDRRNQVLAALQKANPSLIVSYTLPVAQSGLESNALYVLSSAQKYGVKVSTVNIMTMDYGTTNDEATNVESSSKGTISQLSQMGLSANLGITPMIGENDTDPEVLTLADAQTVVNYANSNGSVALLSFWALARDQSCAGDGVQSTCSGLSQSSYQFSKIFEQF